MLKSRLRALLLAGVILSAAVPALAQNRGDLYKWWQSPEVIAQLKLSPEEIDALENLNLELRRKIIGLRNQVQQARVSVDSYFDQDPLDEESINQQFAQMAQAQSEVALEKSRFLLEARKLLGRDRFVELRNLFAASRTTRAAKPNDTQPAN